MEYLTGKEICEKWGITPRMVNYHCSAGRIEGAVKKGNLWLIPAAAKKPDDKRYKKRNIVSSSQEDKNER